MTVSHAAAGKQPPTIPVLLFYMKLNRQIAADVIQPSNQTVKH
jgi:hypothetical protein